MIVFASLFSVSTAWTRAAVNVPKVIGCESTLFRARFCGDNTRPASGATHPGDGAHSSGGATVLAGDLHTSDCNAWLGDFASAGVRATKNPCTIISASAVNHNRVASRASPGLAKSCKPVQTFAHKTCRCSRSGKSSPTCDAPSNFRTSVVRSSVGSAEPTKS